VRVLPEENLGWEENPPTLLEYQRRDQRWMQGNLQYGTFLVAPGLKPVSRFQLAFAMLMFLGSPAWMGLLALGTMRAALSTGLGDFVSPAPGTALLCLVLAMWFAPKIATLVDVLTRPDLRRAFGGGLRLVASAIVETLFFILLSPIMWFSHTLFLAGLPFGRTVGWIGQTRDDHSVPWMIAARCFWPHAVLGWSSILVLLATHPAAIPYALLIAAGPALAVPLAVLSALPGAGRLLSRAGLGQLPEETAPPDALRALALPALAERVT
jgi:membrane glycosyltransferase